MNEMLDKRYPGNALMEGQMSVRNLEIIPRLKAQREELTFRLHKIDKLLGLLEKNPDMVQVIDLSREIGF